MECCIWQAKHATACLLFVISGSQCTVCPTTSRGWGSFGWGRGGLGHRFKLQWGKIASIETHCVCARLHLCEFLFAAQNTLAAGGIKTISLYQQKCTRERTNALKLLLAVPYSKGVTTLGNSKNVIWQIFMPDALPDARILKGSVAVTLFCERLMSVTASLRLHIEKKVKELHTHTEQKNVPLFEYVFLSLPINCEYNSFRLPWLWIPPVTAICSAL